MIRLSLLTVAIGFFCLANSFRAAAQEPKEIVPDFTMTLATDANPAGTDWKVPKVLAGKAGAKFGAGPISLPARSNDQPTAMALNPVCGRAVIGYAAGFPQPGSTRLVVCDLVEGKTIATHTVAGVFMPLALSDDGKQLLMRRGFSGFGAQDRIELWALDGAKLSRDVAWSPYAEAGVFGKNVVWGAFLDNKRLVTTGASGKLVVWELPSLRPALYVQPKGGCTPALSPDHKLLAFTNDANVTILDLDAGKVIAARSTPKLSNPSLSFSPDGKWLGCLGGDKYLVWNFATGELHREILVKGLFNRPHLPVTFPTAEHILVANRYLLDLENQFRLWEYQGEELAYTMGNLTWFVVADGAKKADALVPVSIPHPFIPQALKKAQDDPDYFVLKAGTKVRLDVSGIGDAEQRKKAEAALEARLKAKGFEVTKDGTIDLVVSSAPGQVRRMTYRTLGTTGALRVYNFQEHISRLKFVYQGKTAWEAAGLNFLPHFVRLPAGETMDSFIKKHERPNYAFFETAALPTVLPRPGTPSLGTSRVTAAGLR